MNCKKKLDLYFDRHMRGRICIVLVLLNPSQSVIAAAKRDRELWTSIQLVPIARPSAMATENQCELYFDGFGNHEIQQAFLEFCGCSTDIRRHYMHVAPGKEYDRSYHVTPNLDNNFAQYWPAEDSQNIFYRGRRQDSKWCV